MGIILCERHGRQGTSLVSPEVQRALRENKKALPTEVARVLYTTIYDDDYPPARAWVEPSAARHFGDRVVGVDELMGVELAPACSQCLVAWLRGNGIDASYSTEEQRFLRLAARLLSRCGHVSSPRSRESVRLCSLAHASRQAWGSRAVSLGRSSRTAGIVLSGLS
jgi:hypothetical protein